MKNLSRFLSLIMIMMLCASLAHAASGPYSGGGPFSGNGGGNSTGGGGGSGTVNSGTAPEAAYYATSGTAVSATSLINVGTSSIGIGTATPNQNSILDLSGANNSLLLPIGTTGQRPATGVSGMMRYNNTLASVESYNNGVWMPLTNTILIGVGTTAANPQVSGDNSTGFYSPVSSSIAMTNGGVESWVVNAAHFFSIFGGAATAPSALSIVSTVVATNANLSNYFYVTLTHTASTAISNPTNSMDGQNLTYELTQDSTGTNAITWGTNFDFGASGSPTISTGANKVDLIGFKYSARLSKWIYLGSQLGN